MFLSLLLWALLPGGETALPAGFSAVRSYEASPQHPIMLVGSVDIGADGKIYALDQRLSRVMVWNADGKFDKAFGDMDDTPEDQRMLNAIALGVNTKEVWVWCRGGLMFVYNLDGTLNRVVHFPGLFPKVLGGFDSERFLIGAGLLENNQFAMKFLLAGGTNAHELVNFTNEMIIDGDPKLGKSTFRAYGPDIDVQKDEKGIWHLGFGAAPYLFTLDAKGSIDGQVPIQLPEEAVDPAEIEKLEHTDYPVWSGQRVAMVDDMSQLDYKEPKPGFTQFTLKGGKALFVLTPTGGYLTDLYAPCNRASYRIVDLKSGDVIEKGAYEFPLESKLFFRHGRIFAAIAQPDKRFTFQELSLKGF